MLLRRWLGRLLVFLAITVAHTLLSEKALYLVFRGPDTPGSTLVYIYFFPNILLCSVGLELDLDQPLLFGYSLLLAVNSILWAACVYGLWLLVVWCWKRAKRDTRQARGTKGNFVEEIRQFQGHQSNTTVLVWRLSEIYGGDTLIAKLETKHLEGLWADLANDDAGKAYHAVYTLIGGSKEAVPFLQQYLRPVAAPDAQRLARLLAGLDDDQFAVREEASQQLEQLDELARPALEKALSGQSSAEVKLRAQILLDKLSPSAPERLRVQRALTALEQIGSLDAIQLLEALAKGADGALLTEEARAARKRMKP